MSGFLQGAPPEGHPRQCKRQRRTGHRCRKWAITGSEYCQFHGGSGKRAKVRNNHLPKFYSKYLTDTLNEALEQQLELDSHEQLNLQEELALMRLSSGQAMALWAAAQQLPKDNANRDEMIMSAALVMREALQSVAQLCKDAASVEAARKDAITPMDLKQIVNQLVRLLYSVCGEEHEDIARRFELRVKDEIRLPNDIEGTTLNPTQDVIDMLATIPKEES